MNMQSTISHHLANLFDFIPSRNEAGSGATGKCSSGKWSVTDDRQNKHTLDKLLAFCYYTKPTRFCLPSEPKLFLFAYSRDFSWSDLDRIVYQFSRSPNVAPEFKTFAHVQIDAVEQQEIHFSENYTAFYESIRPQILNPPPGFGDSVTGSDLTNVLATYLKTQPRIACGARIFAVLKRYPNQEDVSELVSLLQQYRITLEITVSADTIGGDGVDVVYQLTGQTYGIRRPSRGDANIYYYTSQLRHNQVSSYYPVFISNVYVSGNGSITLPDLEIPFDGTYMISYGYVEKAKDIWNATHIDSDCEWINVESSEVLHAPPWTFWRVGVFASELNMTRGLYHSKFNYQFRKNDEMRIQLRVHSLT
ncbi:hypothetical protein CAEBREN_09418 [Caenorhabditis brenneri]|uniref:DUF7154 domain-containing protein n=1 Tax=Caenorhabditis brenneri TaxID=135651 RepID=G0N2L3_CAEBE|nr:hypothetical protein CAEBREN_09418 [Caenorhabditis brenneri]